VAQYPRSTQGWQRHSISAGAGGLPSTAATQTTLLDAPMATMGAATGTPGNLGNPANASNNVGVRAFGRTVAVNGSTPLGDWTNNMGNSADGGTVWLPDQFYQRLGFGDRRDQTSPTGTAFIPYFSLPYGAVSNQGGAQGYFSPSRQVTSAIGLFGTLPSTDGNGATQPWQTLLFCPNPAQGTTHPGFGTYGSVPADHLFLDLFWMPVVEPYAISEPLSTAGKINLNYQIVPFTYIKRQTGLYALLKSTKITAIPSTPATMLNDYKSAWRMRANGVSTRLNIDTAETLKAFDTRFSDNDLFRSASQICEMFLVPEGQTAGNVQSFWSNMKLTGDNSREAPYNHIYPRITTKSNTYQVHYRVQVLTKSPNAAPDTFDTGFGDTVASEYRGSSVIERYVDANDKTLPDFATAPAANLDSYYRFRVLSTKGFQP
jgi:uncharacterized protein (TIGR02600 family)